MKHLWIHPGLRELRWCPIITQQTKFWDPAKYNNHQETENRTIRSKQSIPCVVVSALPSNIAQLSLETRGRIQLQVSTNCVRRTRRSHVRCPWTRTIKYSKYSTLDLWSGAGLIHPPAHYISAQYTIRVIVGAAMHCVAVWSHGISQVIIIRSHLSIPPPIPLKKPDS